MTILRATVTEVPLGTIKTEGLLIETSEFAIAVTQANELLEFTPARQGNESKTVKRLLGERFQPVKLKTELNPNAVTALLLKDFELLLVRLVAKGNTKATELAEALVGLSLHQLFCDAFKVKFETEERQEWLTERFHHKTHFHPHLTKWLKEDESGNSSAVNWGKAINLFKGACKLPLTCVDTWDSHQLQVLNHAETSYNSLRLAGLPHEKAIAVIELQH